MLALSTNLHVLSAGGGAVSLFISDSGIYFFIAGCADEPERCFNHGI